MLRNLLCREASLFAFVGIALVLWLLMRAEQVGLFRAGIGEPCHASSECKSRLCLDSKSGEYCTEKCQRDDDCPAGFRCQAAKEDFQFGGGPPRPMLTPFDVRVCEH